MLPSPAVTGREAASRLFGEDTFDINLGAARVLGLLVVAAAEQPSKVLVGVASEVGLANVPVVALVGLVASGRSDLVVQVADDVHEAQVVESNLLCAVSRLKKWQSDVGRRVDVECHGLGLTLGL